MEVTHLGDGVYAEHDGFGIALRANDHRETHATDNIYLEPSVLAALVNYQKRMMEAKDEQN